MNGQSHKPLRVALALESSGPGGAEHMLVRLAAGLREYGVQSQIVTMREGWMTRRASQLNVPVTVRPQSPGLDPIWVPRFARWLRDECIDVLHTHEFAMNTYGGMSALLARVPSIATLHGRHYATESLRRRAAYRLLMCTGMMLVAVSDELAQFLEQKLALRPGEVPIVPNGIPVPERPCLLPPLRASLGVPASVPLLLAVGNLYAVKDHATLLRAACLIPGSHVVIAGRGEERPRLEALAKRLAINERLHLLGLRDDIPSLLASADVFVHPSISEGLPLAVLEAMASRVPVVATRVGGLPQLIQDGESGVLVPPRNPALLAAAIRRVLDQPGKRAALVERAYATVTTEFSIDRMLERYIELYRVCTSGHGG